MKKKQLIVAIAITAVCLFAVGGTLAWLFAVAGPVENTFTVGDINIELNEALVDENGQAVPDAERVTENSYHIYPGAQFDKDPTATVLSGSEPCYVFICVDNGLLLADGAEVCALDISGDWAAIAADGSKTLYQYAPAQGSAIINAAEADVALPPIFTQAVISGELVTKVNINELSGKTIVVNAYAHQAAGLTEAEVTAAAEQYFGF